jgi:hypothetical protein
MLAEEVTAWERGFSRKFREKVKMLCCCMDCLVKGATFKALPERWRAIFGYTVLTYPITADLLGVRPLRLMSTPRLLMHG